MTRLLLLMAVVCAPVMADEPKPVTLLDCDAGECRQSKCIDAGSSGIYCEPTVSAVPAIAITPVPAVMVTPTKIKMRCKRTNFTNWGDDFDIECEGIVTEEQ